MGMENAASSAENSSAYQRDIPSLLKLATDRVQKNIHQEVKKDAALLQDANELNATNLEKNIKNEIALLGLPEELSEKVKKAYKKSSRWGSRSDGVAYYLDHKDQDRADVLTGKKKAEDFTSEYVVFCNANSDASQVAVITESSAWTHEHLYHWIKPNPTGRLLYLWSECPPDQTKWSKKVQAKIADDAEDVVWAPSDNQICVAGKQAIMVFARENKDDDFSVLHTIPVVRYRDEAFDIMQMYQRSRGTEQVWEKFGRFNWNHEAQELVVETERDFIAKKACLAIMQMHNGAMKQTQTIEIPLGTDRGIDVIDWDEEGALQISQGVEHDNPGMRVHFYDKNKEGVYQKSNQLTLSEIGIRLGLRGESCFAQTEDRQKISYALSQTQKDALRSMYMMYCDRFNKEFRERSMVIAIREHPEYGMRSLGYWLDRHSIFDQFGFKVCNKEQSLHDVAKAICAEIEDDRFYDRNHRNHGEDAAW